MVRYPNGNVGHYVNVCFACAVEGGELTTCDETLDLAYFPLSRAAAFIR